MHFLFFFLDGIGLGSNDTQINPFARAEMPALQKLLDGHRMMAGITPYHTLNASLISLDACLGIPGMPQSATGQAVLLTGRNIPAELGYHYGPWPNSTIADSLKNGNLFSMLKNSGRRVAFLNAYPPRYFEVVNSGRKLYSAIPLAVTNAGLALKTADDLHSGTALSADFTALGWRDHLGITDTPVLNPYQAGQRLARLAQENDFSFFEYWLSDYAGHGQDMEIACALLESFDQVIEGLMDAWDQQSGMLLLTSDHGNMEDLSTRRHTANPVPALLVGPALARRVFCSGLRDLTDITPAILHCLK
jgi:2,3-bisphosphoglycerate-independent phosphoglycerate mutase